MPRPQVGFQLSAAAGRLNKWATTLVSSKTPPASPAPRPPPRRGSFSARSENSQSLGRADSRRRGAGPGFGLGRGGRRYSSFFDAAATEESSRGRGPPDLDLGLFDVDDDDAGEPREQPAAASGETPEVR